MSLRLWISAAALAALAAVPASALAGPKAATGYKPKNSNAFQELATGHQYEPGDRVGSAAGGVSWVLPDEWLGGLPPDMPAFVLGSNTRSGIGMVYVAGGATVARLVDMLKEPQQIGDGVILTPTAPPVISGSRVSVTYTGEQYGGPALALIGPEGQSVVFCFAGPKEQTPYYRTVIEDLAHSTVFTHPETAGIEKQWKDLLAGMLLKEPAGSGDTPPGREETGRTWLLCTDGRYRFTDNSSASIRSEGGRWHLEMAGVRALLVLEPDDGTTSRHALQYDGRATFLDGERVYRVAGQGCP